MPVTPSTRPPAVTSCPACRAVPAWNTTAPPAGLEASAKAGLRVKLNAVVCRGVNDGDDVVELARLTLANPWQVRFIEQNAHQLGNVGVACSPDRHGVHHNPLPIW